MVIAASIVSLRPSWWFSSFLFGFVRGRWRPFIEL